MAPSEGKAINMGQGALAGAAVVGVGALAYYGAGLSGEMGAAEKSVMWPQYVKDRIRDTYMSVSHHPDPFSLLMIISQVLRRISAGHCWHCCCRLQNPGSDEPGEQGRLHCDGSFYRCHDW